MSEEEKEEELVLTNDEYYQYLLDNYYSCLDKEKIKRMPKKDKVVDPEVLRIDGREIVVKNYTYWRIKRILKKYFGNPEKGGFRLEKNQDTNRTDIGDKENYSDIIDNETGEFIFSGTTLKAIRVCFSKVAEIGFPLNDMYDQIFMFRLKSWNEHGFTNFPE